MTRIRFSLILSLIFVSNVSLAQILSNDFDNTNNPGNGWTHGFNDVSAGGGLDVLNDVTFGRVNLGGDPGDRWTGDGTDNGDFPPNDLISVNLGNGSTAGDHWGGGEITWDAGVAYHTWGDSTQSGGGNDLSGDDTIFSTYSVPSTGSYNVMGTWTENGNSGGAAVDILVNGFSIGSSSVDLDIAEDTTTIQSLGLVLTAGDEVSFRTTRDLDVGTGGSSRLDASVLNAIAQTLTLQVDVNSGVMQIVNLSGNPITFDAYQIRSINDPGSLDSSGFNGVGGDLPGFSLGTGVGDGWEVSEGSNANALTDSYLTGSSTLQDGEVLPLGSAYDGSVDAQDLLFAIGQSGGGELIGEIDYSFVSESVAGDFNNDGTVDAADYTVWRDNLGSSTSLPNDNNLGTPVTAAHYNLWAQNFGQSSSTANSQTVPEPASLALLFVVFFGVIVLSRRCQNREQVLVVSHVRSSALSSSLCAVVAICGAASMIMSNTAQAAVYNDRVYLFGDSDSALGLENAQDGQPIGGMNQSPLPSDQTIDSGPTLGNPSGTRLQLERSGAAEYRNVGPSGLARPSAVNGDFGVMFNGTDDRLNGISLNRPDELATKVLAASGTIYPINYNGIVNRGLQAWVYPEQTGINAGNYQSIVFDTALSGGPALNKAGQWTQSNNGHVEGGDAVPVREGASVVVGDQWYHVMQHNFNANDSSGPQVVLGSGTVFDFTSVVYVDGVAVSANNDSIDTGGHLDYPGDDLVVGAAEIPFDQVTPTYGLFFDGVVDDLEMYVHGDNTSQGGMNYGTFDLFSDNKWIADTIANDPLLQGTLASGDINRDGAVNGDGTGSVGSDDISAFIAGWGSANRFQGTNNDITVGDWNTWAQGDMNLDGKVDFYDWFILRTNHPSPASLNLGELLSVPEPSACVLLAAGLGVFVARRRTL